jgi:ADP-dependent NAD(P)H-hydrate dehydratase / NAD(P)H-hydrate epimerase
MAVPIISVAQMREWEKATWATDQTEKAVIARVGEALVAPVRKLNRRDGLVLVLAGKGHNGDDGRALAANLCAGEAELLNVTDPVSALEALRNLLQQKTPTLVVDGLFGVGLNRPLDEDWQKLIAAVNEIPCPILAVDVPSGLNADTGEALPVAIRARETYTVGAPKRGMLANAATEFVGRLHVLGDVGLIPCPCTSELQWNVAADFAPFPPARPVTGHKGTFGHAALVAGSEGYHGASVLAARGAQRARPGLVTLFTQSEIYAPVAAQLQAVMVHIFEGRRDFEKFSAVLFGPGLAATSLSSTVREFFLELWQNAACPVVVDASALDWVEPAGSRTHCRILTPHPGEAARLLKCSTAEVQADRFAAVRDISKKFGDCWVVLKGHQTVIGRSTGPLHVNSSGDSGLGQGGTGDLLAGFITGWLAQPALQRDPASILSYAVWEHGAAAERLSAKRENWVVEELAAELGR